jgi:hypothetical protein
MRIAEGGLGDAGGYLSLPWARKVAVFSRTLGWGMLQA